MGLFSKWFGRSRKAKLAEAEARAETERAKRAAEAALVNDQDSESARLASERRLRRLGRRSGIAGTAADAKGGKLLLGQ